MKKIDLKKSIVDIKGVELKSGDVVITFGDVLSNIMLAASEGGKMKIFLIAQKCASEDSIEVDSADFGLIKTAVEKTVAYTGNLVQGQVLVYLDELKDESTKV